MSAEELDTAAIQARANAATWGPWRVDHGGIYSGDARDPGGIAIAAILGSRPWTDDADFIAHARTDVPVLLDEVVRLRNAIKDAPHDYECAAGTYPDEDCTCWKAGPDVSGLEEDAKHG